MQRHTRSTRAHAARRTTSRPLLVALAWLSCAAAVRADQADPDPVLARVLREALERSPELMQARHAVKAEGARVPQASALADPMVALGVQNDGLDGFTIGSMEGSWISLMVSQAFPFPGKRDLRTGIAALDQRRAEARLERALLALEGRVRRAFLDWQVGREQLGLLGELEALWAQAEHTVRARYESGQAPQSDLLRAQLERARLEQRRWAAEAEVSNRLAELNRLRARPLDEALEAPAKLEGSAAPAVPAEVQAAQEAEAQSPELKLAALGLEQAAQRVELARKERLPDFSVTAGLMYRGSLPPMWLLTVGAPVPLFWGSKQGRVIEEGELRAAGEGMGREAVRQLLALRTRQRLQLLAAQERVNRRTREVVLPLSDATVRSTLAQYEVGRTPFNAVLEALAAWVNDRTAWVGGVAESRRLLIAQRELSLDAPGAAGGAAMATGGMPGTSGGGGAAPAGGGSAPAQAGQQQQGQSMSGGM